MSKVATKISGILTLICSIILLMFSLVLVGKYLEIQFIVDVFNGTGILGGLAYFFYRLFVELPAELIGLLLSSINREMLLIIFISLFVAFSALSIFFGIKEIVISKRDDFDFARCKKTCWFMFFTKFMFFVYVVFALSATFFIDIVKNFATSTDNVLSSKLGFGNGFLIITTILSAIAFVLFLLPTINLSVVAKKVNKDSAENKRVGEELQNNLGSASQNEDPQVIGQFYQQNPQPTMQANMPPLPGFNSSVSTFQQPVNNEGANVQTMPQQSTVSQNPTANQNMATNAPQTQTSNISSATAQNSSQTTIQPTAQPTVQSNVKQSTQPTVQSATISTPQPATSQIAPMQSGANVPPQGAVGEKMQADLDRIERLKNMGAITEENYQAMKKKILEGN